MKEVFSIVGFLALVLVVMACIMLPVAWLDGHAKSAYMSTAHGIDIPWYEATWLTVEVNTTQANISLSD